MSAGRVLVGMSGGVDSSLSAALLVERGFDVTGVYLRTWSRDLPGHKCPWADDLADAERVAARLGIELVVWDCEEEYRRGVVDYLVDSYRRGLTPNPDVMCNEKVKFGVFARRAFAEGADYVATGHYARTAPLADAGRASLVRAADEHKDQTYFLWRVDGTTLARTLFPIGDIPTKAQVRTLAAERGLVTAAKPDSQGICFVGPVGLRPFLLDYLDRCPGDIVEWGSGRVLGRHEGAFLYTVGQRKGLDLGGGPARYVVSVDASSNVVTVTDDPRCPGLWCRELRLTDVCWVNEPPADGAYQVRCRHTGELMDAEIHVEAERQGEANGEGSSAPCVTVRFPQPRRTVAPGQSVVLYEGLTCLGGGIVASCGEPCDPDDAANGDVR
ncbi:MAG: tRNA 2-thiouridine(34) synthase MnmA [Coriobacteriia bacterium]|nr:tRNA 2-thiouridine(34) synthase MnmA [Coriobacteriia bacterium]MBS5477549.1 tRNA 2-thiouridine(34) synthase MnmA [Coriobacteriia bacterium]